MKREQLILIGIAISFISSYLIVPTSDADTYGDLDPLVNVKVTFHLLELRSLEKNDYQVLAREYVDRDSPPDFYVKVWINDVLFMSTVWYDTAYLYNPNWSVTADVPDNKEIVNIKIQLWDWNPGKDQLCDISGDYANAAFNSSDEYDVELYYSIKYGLWWGDDYTSDEPVLRDPSGYGRLNGCDDGSIYQHDRDCEMWFKITQTDFDGDGIPYWAEVNVLHTDPMVNDSYLDPDGDGIPTYWEYIWGHRASYSWRDETYQHYWVYNASAPENFSVMDSDNDGLDNIEEYLTSEWGSDPFRKDLFIELDHMADSPRGEKSDLPLESKELLRTVFDRRNIVYHLDDGCMGGGETIPFDNSSTMQELRSYYWNYFLHGNPNNWRRGVFHYGLVVYHAKDYPGFVFWNGANNYLDSYQISSKDLSEKSRLPQFKKVIVFASAYMHECGHTLGIFNSNTPGCDDQESKAPWQPNYWKWRPYKSVMNYGYIYRIVDYSDGSRGKNDFNDWERIDLTFFQRELW
ncbi:MAG: hypothetical protein J7K13_02620 [Thermoplasmata archaeon]|nr:hypothetical protein [Thermoplasmata archaeon]